MPKKQPKYPSGAVTSHETAQIRMENTFNLYTFEPEPYLSWLTGLGGALDQTPWDPLPPPPPALRATSKLILKQVRKLFCSITRDLVQEQIVCFCSRIERSSSISPIEVQVHPRWVSLEQNVYPWLLQSFCKPWKVGLICSCEFAIDTLAYSSKQISMLIIKLLIKIIKKKENFQ